MNLFASRDPMARVANGINSYAIADEIIPKTLGQETLRSDLAP